MAAEDHGVRIEDLSRAFPGAARPAVDSLSLDVATGETLCLVGPSGCGKSTTLRIVAGLETADQGRVTIGGRDMAGVAPQDRDVAMVFQGFALYPHLTVRKILAFPLEMRGVPRAEREKAVLDAASMLGIGSLLDRRPAELSGGEQQRVAMGRAIVRRPRVFLFDEPLSNLDAALRAELRTELARLLRRLEATAIYVTHDQSEAMTLGHRIAVLRAGRVEQVAPPREIYEQPKTEFVAGFFGTPPMNLLNATRDGDRMCAGSLRVPAPAGGIARCVVGVRPEHVRFIERTGSADTEEGARATVAAVEPHGAESHVELDAGGAQIVARMAGFFAGRVGDDVAVHLDEARVRFFDHETGKAL